MAIAIDNSMPKGGESNFLEIGNRPIFIVEKVEHTPADSDTKTKVEETDISFLESRKTEIVNTTVPNIGNHRS